MGRVHKVEGSKAESQTQEGAKWKSTIFEGGWMISIGFSKKVLSLCSNLCIVPIKFYNRAICNNIVKVLSLKVDGVSRLNRCFLGVNVQYIDKGQVCIRTLGVPELTGRHTRENLRDVIIEVSEEYDINIKKVYTSTTDNGSNMMKVSDLLKEMQEAQEIDDAALEVDMRMPEVLDLDFVLLNEDEMVAVEKQSLTAVPCAAHVLQLAVENFLVKAEVKTLKYKSRVCRS
nr:PREDICTED: uncharacterized protein LOC109038074 [Bemisia tabaci]